MKRFCALISSLIQGASCARGVCFIGIAVIFSQILNQIFMWGTYGKWTMDHSNGVIGMSGLLLRTELDDTQTQYAEIVHGCSKSLITIINDVLDLSKIDAQKVTLQSEVFTVRDMIEDLIALHRPGAIKKSLQLSLQFSPNVPQSIIADEGRLRQIINNLIECREIHVRRFCWRDSYRPISNP